MDSNVYFKPEYGRFLSHRFEFIVLIIIMTFDAIIALGTEITKNKQLNQNHNDIKINRIDTMYRLRSVNTRL